jgi:hypothetical protein
MAARVWPIFRLRSMKVFGASALISVALLLSSQLALAQFTQQGPKLVGTGAVGTTVEQGASVAVSADGNTAIVGGIGDNSFTGAVWVFTRSGGVWTQQGNKLVGTGAVGNALQGNVALSADGTTAITGGDNDNSLTGAAWVFTRGGGVWTQQGSKLVGNDAVYTPPPVGVYQGRSVALSADGNTAMVGGCDDDSGTGAAWVYARSGGVWTQQGSKLVGTGAVGRAAQGDSVALSGDGNTAIVGGLTDNGAIGAAWAFTRTGGVWTQQGSKLVGTGAVGEAAQGRSVALSADGNTAIVGGFSDNSYTGAAWVYTRSGGVWTQQGGKLVGTGAVGGAAQGVSVALSGDGNTAMVGGQGDNSATGAAWVYTRSGGVWTQKGNKLVGTGAVGGFATQGSSVALSADGNTAIVGGDGDNSNFGAAWVFVQPSLQVTPAINIVTAGNPGGPFSPSSFSYTLSATSGSVDYSISGVPNWLTPSSTSGTATTGTTVTFTVNANANRLAVGNYGPTTITFANSDTGYGTTTVTATLTVNPPSLLVTPTTNVAASGTQGGPFSPPSFSYALSATYGSVNYSIITPSWLAASAESGTATTSAKTITFKINSSANGLNRDTYVNSINFYNTTNNQGNTTRLATLTVNPKQYKITVEASPKPDGTVSGGGTFAEGSSNTVTATPNAGHTFVHWTESGRVVSTSETYALTLNGNVNLVADFR